MELMTDYVSDVDASEEMFKNALMDVLNTINKRMTMKLMLMELLCDTWSMALSYKYPGNINVHMWKSYVDKLKELSREVCKDDK